MTPMTPITPTLPLLHHSTTPPPKIKAPGHSPRRFQLGWMPLTRPCTQDTCRPAPSACPPPSGLHAYRPRCRLRRSCGRRAYPGKRARSTERKSQRVRPWPGTAASPVHVVQMSTLSAPFQLLPAFALPFVRLFSTVMDVRRLQTLRYFGVQSFTDHWGPTAPSPVHRTYRCRRITSFEPRDFSAIVPRPGRML
jgi:hypothetical protein